MNTFAEIQICGKTYGREWLLQHRDSLHELSLNETEQQTLEFCGRWLAEAREFEIKTSGTTGGIKSVKIKREQMIRSAEMTGQVLGLTPGDRALVCLSINYIAGVMMLVRGLVLGLTMVVVPPVRDPFVALGPDARDFEFASFVPLQLAALLSCRDYHPVLNRMKVVLVGGAAVSPSLLRRVRMLQVPVYQSFAMTETVSHIALRRLNGEEMPGNYTPLPDVKITRAGNGCLRIKSPVTGNVWVQTSDLVTIDAAGGFEWSGRIDNLINSGGIKISPEKIEQNIALALLDHDLGDEELNFFVTGWPDRAYGEVVALIFEKSAMSAGFVTKLRDSLSQRLSSYEIPKHFINVESFVRTRTGKIERTATLSKVLAGEQI